MISEPKVTNDTGSYLFLWEREGIACHVGRIKDSREGLSADLLFKTTAPGSSTHLHQARLNLTATRSRKEFAHHLAGRRDDVDWEAVLEQVCVYVVEKEREGEPIEEIWPEGATPPRYLLYPLIPEGIPTIIFGEGASGKSTLALILAACAILPWEDNPLGLIPPKDATNVLYLDYESDAQDIKWKLHALCRGMGLPSFPLHYRRSFLPLADDVDQIRAILRQKNAHLLIVDSLGMASGGDLNSTEPTLRFFHALRSLNTTSLLTAHTAKSELTKTKTVFGSSFFNFLTRSIWEVKKAQELEEDSLSLALFHRKFNRGKPFKPLGFRFSFGEDTLTVARQDAREDFLDSFPLSIRVLEALKGGSLTRAELMEELGETKPDTLSQILQRLKRRGQVNRVGDAWGLAAPREDT